MQITKVGVITHPRVDAGLIKKAAAKLEDSEAEVFFDPVAAGKIEEKATEVGEMDVDLALVMGGDGTLLWVVNELRCRPLILGVNIGKVGYLSELKPENLIEYLGKLFKGEYEIDPRTKIEVEGEEALNEALVVAREPATLLEFKIWLDGVEVADFRADGVMIATPTGSTGYSLSAGGPLLHPKVSGYTITPINTFLKKQPPLVVPDDSTMEIGLLREDRGAQLILDGRHIKALEPGGRITIKKTDENVRFVRFSPRFNYYHINIGRLR